MAYNDKKCRRCGKSKVKVMKTDDGKWICENCYRKHLNILQKLATSQCTEDIR